MQTKSDILIEILLALPDRTITQKMYISRGTTVGEIKNRGDLLLIFIKVLKKTNSIAIDGKKVPNEYQISNGERLVILRPLIMDPKEMRRIRSIKL